MRNSNFDRLYGRHFSFQPFANDFVSIESAGSSILVGIKNHRGEVIYEWLVSYPFDKNYDTPPKSKCGWELTMGHRTPNSIQIEFKKDGYEHTLTLKCTDRDLKPKPIGVHWE